MGRFDDAKKEYQFILNTRASVSSDVFRLTVRQGLARQLDNLGMFSEAADMYLHVYEKFKKSQGDNSSLTVGVLNNLAYLKYRMKDYPAAISTYLKVIRRRVCLYGASHPLTLMSEYGLSTVYRESSQLEKAMELFNKLLDKACTSLNNNDPFLLTYKFGKALCLEQAGQYVYAVQIFEDVFQKRLEILKVEHPNTILSFNCLIRCLESLGETDQVNKLLLRFPTLECKEIDVSMIT